MKFKFLYLIFFSLFIFLFPQEVFAGEPPQQSSPANGSTTSSSKLEWQAPSYALYAGNNFRVQVDDDSSFSSLNKDYYTDNNYYSPNLSDGVWYWRVKAKDSGGVWSEWSSIWSFTLTTNSPTPSPSSSPEQSSDSPPYSNPTPTPGSTSVPTSTPSSTASAFIISNVPSQINSDQSFSASVNLTLPNNPNTKFYLKGAFKKDGSSNYFGKTLVSDAWIKNGSSYSSQFSLTTDLSGSWSGSLEVMPDYEDSGFTGSGDYIFKVGRYTSSGSGPTWSNEVTIKINASEVETNNEGGTGGSNNSSKATPKPISTSTNSPKNLSSNTSSIIKLPKRSEENVASVAGAEVSPTSSPETEVLSKKETNFIPWIGGGFILAGLSSLGLIYLKNKGIYEKFFKQIR